MLPLPSALIRTIRQEWCGPMISLHAPPRISSNGRSVKVLLGVRQQFKIRLIKHIGEILIWYRCTVTRFSLEERRLSPRPSDFFELPLFKPL